MEQKPVVITVEVLRKKIADIDAQEEKALANLNALAGARQAFELLIRELEGNPDSSPSAPADVDSGDDSSKM